MRNILIVLFIVLFASPSFAWDQQQQDVYERQKRSQRIQDQLQQQEFLRQADVMERQRESERRLQEPPRNLFYVKDVDYGTPALIRRPAK